MQRLGGTLLLLAGSALGAYAILPAPPDGAERLAEVTRISAAPDRDVRSQISAAPSAAANAKTETVNVRGLVATGTTAAAAVVPPIVQTPSTWSTVVTAETDNSAKLKSPKPGDTETRAEMTRDLQRQLQRVGCYSGEITGTWTPASKRAMTAFMDRVNATLPVDEPDYILLTLVQGHKSEACGATCPVGQALDGGRCVPNVVIAKATRKQQRDEERRVAEAQKAEQQQRITGELRISEKKRVAEVRRTGDARSAGNTRVAEVTPAPERNEQLPWLDAKKQDATAAPAAPVAREPLPGRMSVGAPIVTETEKLASVAAVTPGQGAAPVLPSPSDEAATDGSSDLSGALSVSKTRPASRKSASPFEASPADKTQQTSQRVKRSFAKTYADQPRKAKVRTALAAKRAPLTAYGGAKVAKRFVYFVANKPRRHDTTRPGTASFYVMRSLGGVYY